LFMDLGRPRDALSEFEAALLSAPNRYRALHGAAISAASANERTTARGYYARLVEVAENSESRPELVQARSFLSAEE